MEEILASIRRVISEDEEINEEAGSVGGDTAVASGDEEKDEDNNILELTLMLTDYGDVIDLAKEKKPEEKTTTEAGEQKGVSADQGVNSAAGAAIQQTASSGKTLEDIVKELLRPMLKEWLDQNLPPLPEKLIRTEVERAARRAKEL